jgi:hypothetical protein
LTGVWAAAGFVGRNAVGIHKAEIREAEIGHGARCRTDIEWIAWGNEDDTQVFQSRYPIPIM